MEKTEVPDYELAKVELAQLWAELVATFDLKVTVGPCVAGDKGFDNETVWHHVANEVTVKGRNTTFTQTYRRGIACIEWKKVKSSRLSAGEYDGLIVSLQQTPNRNYKYIGNAVAIACNQQNEKTLSLSSKCITPLNVAEVIASCCRDGYEAHEYGWKDWCSELGMNSDSIKGKALWERCADIYHTLCRVIGKDNVVNLSMLSGRL